MKRDDFLDRHEPDERELQEREDRAREKEGHPPHILGRRENPYESGRPEVRKAA